MISNITLQVSFTTTQDQKEQHTTKIQNAHVMDGDPVNQKEESGTMGLELVSLLTKISPVLCGRLHFVPSLGI